MDTRSQQQSRKKSRKSRIIINTLVVLCIATLFSGCALPLDVQTSMAMREAVGGWLIADEPSIDKVKKIITHLDAFEAIIKGAWMTLPPNFDEVRTLVNEEIERFEVKEALLTAVDVAEAYWSKDPEPASESQPAPTSEEKLEKVKNIIHTAVLTAKNMLKGYIRSKEA